MEETPSHFLFPGNIFAHNQPYKVNTILGSCVAVCLFDPINKVGGINHYMLPLWNAQGLASPKYGNIAIERLLEKVLELGAKRVNLIAKVFGGGEVIDTEIKSFKIGERNIELALEILKELKIPIKAQSVGGKLGRRIQFNVTTGEVLHKFIEKTV